MSAVDEATAALRRELGERRPRIGITLGSGLGGLETRIAEPAVIPFDALPGWPRPTVEGHAGRVTAGRLGGVEVIGLAGRTHLYEGAEPARVGFYVRVLGALGVPILLLTNAAGAINRRFRPGRLMLIADHLDLAFRNPLIGPAGDGESRFPDMHSAYDPELRRIVREVARREGIPLREGVYAAVSGPSYETPAEIRMLERFGADAVGMSTAPEVIVARAIGIRCVAVSCLTNFAAGVGDRPLDHAEVLEMGERVAEDFQRLVIRSVERIGALDSEAA